MISSTVHPGYACGRQNCRGQLLGQAQAAVTNQCAACDHGVEEKFGYEQPNNTKDSNDYPIRNDVEVKGVPKKMFLFSQVVVNLYGQYYLQSELG